MARLIAIIGCLILVVACGMPAQSPSAVSQASEPSTAASNLQSSRAAQTRKPSMTPPSNQPTLKPTNPPTAVRHEIPAIHVYIGEADFLGTVADPLKFGTSARFIVELTPTVVGDGYVGSAFTTVEWSDLAVKEMRLCLMVGIECALPEEWQPFQSEPTETMVEVDWVGEQKLWVGLEVRDTSGNLVPLVYDFEVVDRYYFSKTIMSEIDLTVPVSEQPPPAQTAIAATQTAFPVAGTITIADGRCCVGGLEGGVVTIPVRFTAASPYGNVTSMRIMGANSFPDSDSPAWEPFVNHKEFQRSVGTNFIGWGLCVQYKDDQENRSPVYCDDISIEGMPKRP